MPTVGQWTNGCWRFSRAPMKLTFAKVAPLVELGLHHEQQHQELLVTDVKHIFGCNPLRPPYT